MTKIDIISGFLGAGKTTLIKKLLSDAYKGEQVVLIENEFGEIGIDGGFLKEAGIEIREMNSGCICCSLVGDFGKSLHEVVDTYHPDRILIEPSGVGKLSDVIKAVQDVQGEIDAELNSFTTVVDVTKCKIYRKNFGEFFSNQALLDGIANVKENNSDLHLYGLLSDGGVHSHITHLYGLLELAKRQGVKNVYVHCFLDGRDTAPTSGKGFIEALEAKMAELGIGKIASISGRYYAMDRDNRWDRVELAYKALTKGEGVEGTDAAEAVQASYDAEKTDEFVLPTVLKKDGKPVATIQDKDSVVFFNFRPDRARELTRAFCADEFTGFEREKRLDLTYVCFTEYDETIPNKSVAFKKEEITNTFGEYLAAHNMTQARIAETEKYAHVTFFFNGGVEEPNKGEDRILVKSPKVATYDLKPEMSAYEVCDKLVGAIKSENYDVIVINFANPDMVGHTGVQAAAIKAVEAVDECVGKAVEALKEVDGQMFICADHGNAEQLIDEETGERDEKSLKRQADRYQEMFELLKKMDTASGGPCNITSVTVFGICDDYPLYDDLVQCLYLWDKNAKPKESFYRVREVGESK